jgi:hypothetical protein
VAACGAIELAHICELLFQIRKSVLEHFPMARVLARLQLLLQVSARQEQSFLLA